MPKPVKSLKKTSYSISILTYRKLTRYLETKRGPSKQVNLFKFAVDALKADSSGLRNIPAKIRGGIRNKTSRVLVNTFDEDSVKTVEGLAEEYDLFNAQVVDAAFRFYIGDQVLCGEELTLPLDLIHIKGWKWPQGCNQTDNFHLSLSRLPKGTFIFLDATVLFAGITTINKRKNPQSEQCAKFIRQCLDREYKSFSTTFEFGRLEQLLASHASSPSGVSDWMSVLLKGIAITDVTPAELAAEEPLASSISTKAALIALVKQREPNSIASISSDFDEYCKNIDRRNPTTIRENPPIVLIPTIYKPIDLPG